MTDQPPPIEGATNIPAEPGAPVQAAVPAAAAEVAAAPVVPAAVPAAAPPPPPVAPPPTTWSGYVAATGPAAGAVGPGPGWEFAGFWIRAIAWIIDGFILGIVTSIFWFVVLAIAGAIGLGAVASVSTDGTITNDQAVVLGVGFLAALSFLGIMTLLVTVLYFVVLWVKRGATIGQSVLGLRVARERDGGPIGWGTGILRYIMLMIGFWIFYLGVIWVAFEPRKRGWHDMVAGTLVVKRH